MGRSKEFDEQEVLQKAMELFWRQGYEKTSMNDLVEHLGIHRKSIYDTYGNKYSLYLKAIEQYSQYTTEKLMNQTLQAKTAYQAVKNIFDYIIEGNENSHNGCLFVNAATEFGPWNQEVLAKVEDAFKQEEKFILEILVQGQKDGEFSQEYDTELLGDVLHTTLVGLRVSVKTANSEEKMRNVANFFLNLISN